MDNPFRAFNLAAQGRRAPSLSNREWRGYAPGRQEQIRSAASISALLEELDALRYALEHALAEGVWRRSGVAVMSAIYRSLGTDSLESRADPRLRVGPRPVCHGLN